MEGTCEWQESFIEPQHTSYYGEKAHGNEKLSEA